MLKADVYGTGVGYDTKANLWVGGNNQKVAIKFKATSSSALNSVRFVQRGGAGYSLGNGGTMAVSVRADDGAGHPSASSLAQQSYTPGNPSGGWEKFDAVTFASPATLTAGTTYYIVFSNTSTSNYISVNSVFIYGGSTPRQPMFNDSEFGLMYTSGAWGSVHSGYTPVVDLTYASGVHAGQAYYEAMIANYATISGASSMARERFTVTGGNKTVNSASIRLRRSTGTSPLKLTLETAAGVAIDSGTVTAASVPVSSPGGDNGGSKWVTVTFATPRVLTNGSTYNLKASTETGTTYTTFPVRSGEDKGFMAHTFTGSGQRTTNGSTWTDLYQWAHQDLQIHFGVTSTSTTTPPTTTPPTTTPPTTTPPTTTPPPAATSLSCPVVVAPKVGQTVTCTYR